MKELILFAVFCTLMCTTAVSSLGQIPPIQSSNTISGFVYSESRAPVGQVYVELQSDFYSPLRRVRTQNSGMFTFSGLSPGQYYLRVITAGTDYDEQTKSVTLQAISRQLANTEQVDFYLRSRKSGAQGAASRPAVVFFQDVPADAEALYVSALEDLSSKRETEAFEKLKRSLEIFPDYFNALDRLGNEYVVRGHYEAAYVLLTKALMVNQRSYSSTLGLGLSVFRLGQTELAVKHFKAAVDIDQTLPRAHLWLGIALHTGKKFSDALKSLLKANELTKGAISEIHWQLARVYKDLNRFGDSADELELFLKANPDAANAAEVRKTIQLLRMKK